MTAPPSLVREFIENRDLIWGFVFSLMRDHAAAEEVFQEVSIVVLEEARGDLEVEKFMTWVREVARRRIAGHYRDRKNLRTTPLSDSLTEVISQAFAENPSPPERHQLRLKLLAECVERLAARSRRIVDGFYRDRQSIKDLAATLGWRPESIKVALMRARKTLADCVATRMRTAEEIA